MSYRDDLAAALARAEAAERSLAARQRRVAELEAEVERLERAARGERVVPPLSMPSADPLIVANQLVERWCQRRCFRALRAMLPGWPVVSGLTDDWAAQLQALEQVWALARGELTEDEGAVVEALIKTIRRMVHRR